MFPSQPCRYGRVLNNLRGALTVWLSESSLIPTRSLVNASIGLGNPIEFDPDGIVASPGPGFDGPGLEFGPGNCTDLSLALLDLRQDLKRRLVVLECHAEDLADRRFRLPWTRS